MDDTEWMNLEFLKPNFPQMSFMIIEDFFINVKEQTGHLLLKLQQRAVKNYLHLLGISDDFIMTDSSESKSKCCKS